MRKLIDLIGRILPVFIGWLIWRETGNIIFGAIAATVLETLAAPLLKELGILLVKKQDIQMLDPFPAEQGKGLRILIARNRSCTRSPEDIVAEMRGRLSDDAEFRHLYQTVVAEHLPIQRCLWNLDVCDEGTQTKAIRQWRKMGDISLMANDMKDGYFHEKQAENGEYAALFCFSQDIPITLLPGETQALSEEAHDVHSQNPS